MSLLRHRRVPKLLRENQEFRSFFAAQTISLFGDQVTLIALPLTAVLALDAGPAQMGYLTAAGLLPHLLFALHAGAWVDRHGHRRHTMVAADLGRAAILVPLPTATDDHQRKNAAALGAEGAAEVLDQRELTRATLATRILALLDDEARRAQLAAAVKRFARPDAARVIVDRVFALASQQPAGA